MSRNRVAPRTALGASLAITLALSFAAAFSACSGDAFTGFPSPRDSSTDTTPCTSCDAGNSDTGQSDAGHESDAAADAARDTGNLPDSGIPHVRIMAANLTSGNNQSYTPAPGDEPGPGARIFKGVKPDIVLIQEFNYKSNSAADLRSFVDTAFGSDFHYFREPVTAAVSIPNGIISRYPILAADEWDDIEAPDRDFAWAKLDIPGDTDLWVISVHLLGSRVAGRSNEASALISLVRQHVPSSDYVILGGDFNTDNRQEQCITTLGERFVTAAPLPDDGAGNGNTNKSRQKPYDWLLGDPRVNGLAVPVVIGSRTFANGLVFDSRVFTPLADVAPVVVGDSNADQMQHMAVIRDFSFH